MDYSEVIFLAITIFGVRGRQFRRPDAIKPLYDISPRPDYCQASIDFLYLQCCVFPPFFARDIAKNCGGLSVFQYTDPKNNVTGFTRYASIGCDYWSCILGQYQLLDNNDYLIEAQYHKHLNLWVDYNPEFTEVMGNAITHCKQSYRYYMPLQVCEFFNYHACIRHHIKLNCPVIRHTEECEKQKEFYDQCGEFFL